MLVWTSFLIPLILPYNTISVLGTTNTTVALESNQVQKIWETPVQLKTPESVPLYPSKNILFVSNIDGKPDEKDGQGFISKVSPVNGTIIELNWVTGLNAPKGMAISSDSSKLYVSDITDLVEIDIANGKIINRYNAPGSAFLNDVVSDGQGNIYVSDTGTNTIYEFDSRNRSSLQIWLQNSELGKPCASFIMALPLPQPTSATRAPFSSFVFTSGTVGIHSCNSKFSNQEAVIQSIPTNLFSSNSSSGMPPPCLNICTIFSIFFTSANIR